MFWFGLLLLLWWLFLRLTAHPVLLLLCLCTCCCCRLRPTDRPPAVKSLCLLLLLLLLCFPPWNDWQLMCKICTSIITRKNWLGLKFMAGKTEPRNAVASFVLKFVFEILDTALTRGLRILQFSVYLALWTSMAFVIRCWSTASKNLFRIHYEVKGGIMFLVLLPARTAQSLFHHHGYSVTLFDDFLSAYRTPLFNKICNVCGVCPVIHIISSFYNTNQAKVRLVNVHGMLILINNNNAIKSVHKFALQNVCLIWHWCHAHMKSPSVPFLACLRLPWFLWVIYLVQILHLRSRRATQWPCGLTGSKKLKTTDNMRRMQLQRKEKRNAFVLFLSTQWMKCDEENGESTTSEHNLVEGALAPKIVTWSPLCSLHPQNI